MGALCTGYPLVWLNTLVDDRQPTYLTPCKIERKKELNVRSAM
jgi:hypothetical protein